jgi:hypothetical protein
MGIRVRNQAVRAGFIAGLLLMNLAIASAAQAQTTKRVAVILFNPRNYGTQWISPEAARGAVWTATKSVDKYYREESYGKWAIGSKLRADGDVFGWYTVPYDNTGACSLSTWMTNARTQAAAQGFVVTNYDAVVYVTSATGCPGRAWASGNSITVLSGFNMQTVAHELGHVFGLRHASAWQCRDSAGVTVSISGTCSSIEYGDFALMGKTTAYHMNNFQKGALGWLAASNTRTVTTSGVYELYPIEKATANVQVLRIPRKFDTYGKPLDFYYLEYRQQYGFDSFALSSPYVNGVSIRVAPEYTQYNGRSYLIDATTPSLTTFGDAPLQVGNVFTDSTRRVTIAILSVVNGVAQVSVSFF